MFKNVVACLFFIAGCFMAYLGIASKRYGLAGLILDPKIKEEKEKKMKDALIEYLHTGKFKIDDAIEDYDLIINYRMGAIEEIKLSSKGIIIYYNLEDNKIKVESYISITTDFIWCWMWVIILIVFAIMIFFYS